MATIAVNVQAAFETRGGARSEVKRHLGALFSNVMKVVPMSGGYVVHAAGMHFSRSCIMRYDDCEVRTA